MRLRWLAVILAVYIGSYLVLSRLGMQWSSRNGYEFYFFFAPEDEYREQLHEVCCTTYWPLIAMERLLGTSDGPSAPLVKEWSGAVHPYSPAYTESRL